MGRHVIDWVGNKYLDCNGEVMRLGDQVLDYKGFSGILSSDDGGRTVYVKYPYHTNHEKLKKGINGELCLELYTFVSYGVESPGNRIKMI